MPYRMCIFERLYQFGAAVADAVLPPRNVSKESERGQAPLDATSKHSLISLVQKWERGARGGKLLLLSLARNPLGETLLTLVLFSI